MPNGLFLVMAKINFTLKNDLKNWLLGTSCENWLENYTYGIALSYGYFFSELISIDFFSVLPNVRDYEREDEY